MTSLSTISPNPTSQTSTNATAPSSTAPSRTPSSSGQTSSSAAVSANAPAPRAAPSYANVASVVTSKKPPTGPATSSNSVSPAPSAPAQHARSASAASVPVNGRIQPAVPNIQNSGNATNGASGIPLSGGQHSRNPSIVANMPNGSTRTPNIKFGGFNETGSGPQPSASASAAGTNLTAPVAPNARSNSPLSSPSPAPQPVASGGAPQQASTRQIQFGDATQHQASPRPASMPPAGPGGMAPQGHARRDSTHSAHGEPGPNVPHGRGMPSGRGRTQGPYNNYQNQQYGNYARGGYPSGGPNQSRNGPNNMGGPPPYHNQPFNPNSPRNMPRSPAMPHASPSMQHAVPTPTPQLYNNAPTFVPGNPHGYPMAAPMGYEQYGYQYTMPYPPQQFPQTSPRPGYVNPLPSGYMPPYPQPHAPSMSRSSSANISEMHQRPASGMGHHPAPSPMTPQPQSMVSPPVPGTPVQPPASPYGAPVATRQKRAPSKALVIKDPITGAPIPPVEPKASPAAAPSTASPGVASTTTSTQGSSARDSEHSRSGSTAQTKTADEKRKEMRDGVLRRMQEAKRLEEEEAKKKQESAEQDEARRKAEEAAAEEKKKKEAEEEALKKAAEEKAKAEAEEKAKKEAEEKAQKEAEEKAKAEAEAKAKAEAEEQAKKEAEEKAAKEKEEAEAAEKAKAEEAEKAAEKKAEEEKSEAATPVATPETSKPATPDSESMPPPPLRSLTEKSKMKPSPLNLQLKTNEPAPPSAALTALRSARPIDNIRNLEYPEGIQSPNPALNPMASSKFKYDKDFLLQFQNVFTEKPSEDWDTKMRETVGDTDSGRPGTARTPSSSLGPRQSSRSGTSGMPPMGGMGQFGSFGKGGMGGFGGSKPATSANPLAGYFGARPGSALPRTGSTTSLSGSNQNPSSPRVGNRSARGSSKRGAGGASMERQDSQKSTLTIPEKDVKPLEISATRWKPISITKKPTAAEATAPPAAPDQPMMAPDMVQRKVKAALNKMTPEKFDKIADQILDITSQSRFENDGRTLRQVIQLTFEKATDEAAWSSMYAKFCKRMLEAMDPNIKDESIRDKYDNVVTGGNLFRKYLLNRCQEEFEKGWKVNLPPKPEGVSDEAVMLSDEYYIAAAAKRRGLGLVQFIGELYKLGMLTERIMNECVRKTLDFEGVPEDETVESLCKLLRTIGAQLDSSEKSKPRMDAYFQRIDSMIQNKELNSRMRFMLMDIVDLRSKGWETKEADKGPKTIAEIREEALKAAAEKEAASRASRSGRPQAGRGDARSFSGAGGYGQQPDRSGGQINMDDLRKLRSSKQASSTPGSFGPSSMFSGRSGSGSGSRRGLGPGASREDSGSNSRTATPPAPQATAHANIFSALSGLSSHHDDNNDGNDATSPPASNAGSPQVSSAQLERVRSTNSTEEAK